jgi:hypothetical protein
LTGVGLGIRATAEGDLLDLLKVSGLPLPLLNADLYLGEKFIARPGAWWPDAGVAVEVDSREWHIHFVGDGYGRVACGEALGADVTGRG